MKTRKTAVMVAVLLMLMVGSGGMIMAMGCGDEPAAVKPAPAPAPAPVAVAPAPVVATKPPAESPAPAPVTVTADGGGSIAGTVKLSGKAPRMRPMKMDADPKCAAMHAEPPKGEEVVVDDAGNVKWAFVYIKKADLKSDLPAAPAVINQQGCKYDPHVLGIVIGQDLLIKNSDDLLHNIHALPLYNKEFNFGQPQKGMSETKKFTAEEVMVKVKCDVHPWMSAWVGVLTHKYFAVTDDKGAYTIKDVPPGKYTVEVWQEKYKSVSMEVEVKDKATAQADFTLADKKGE